MENYIERQYENVEKKEFCVDRPMPKDLFKLLLKREEMINTWLTGRRTCSQPGILYSLRRTLGLPYPFMIEILSEVDPSHHKPLGVSRYMKIDVVERGIVVDSLATMMGAHYEKMAIYGYSCISTSEFYRCFDPNIMAINRNVCNLSEMLKDDDDPHRTLMKPIFSEHYPYNQPLRYAVTSRRMTVPNK